MKYLVAVLIILIMSQTNLVYAQNNEKEYYLTTNLIAPIAGLNLQTAAIKVLAPLLSNMEYGFTLSAGYFKNYHFVECRVTMGQSLPYNFIPQFQLGYQFLIVDKFKKNQNGMYVGANLRYWDYINRFTKIHRHNLVPSLSIGYIWKKKRFITDIRLQQNFAIFTATNIEKTKPAFNFNFSPMPAFSLILPLLSINVGYKISDIKLSKKEISQ